ncbi:arginase [Elysia marginata]|uniref:Arginase n=1 Tax=Elysia marginata TaxID=1093978 RepID=A0AAV4IMK2_9GAST|nr:arginase [Elysia marginata]
MAMSERPLGVLGFSFNKGQPRGGTEQGPRVLRNAGILDALERVGNAVVDHSNVELPNPPDEGRDNIAKNCRAVGTANKKLSEEVSRYLKKGERLLVLGGDHSLGIGSIHGHAQAQPDVVIVWVDAHADLNTPMSSSSGNMHGMPLSFLIRELVEFMPQTPGLDWCKPCLSAKDVVYIGLRDVDPAERLFIEKLGITSFSMQEVDKFGIREVVEKALKAVDPSGKRPIHVSFDVDVMDPAHASATGTPVPGGLSLRESFYLAEEIAATGRLAVLDIAEVNPLLSNADGQKTTVANAVDVTAKFYGSKRQGDVPRDYVIPRPQA